MDNQNITPQLSDLDQKASGNPLNMKGLMHILSTNYSEGMTLEDLKITVGTAVKEQLQHSLQKLDPATALSVMSFLSDVDYTLSIDNDKVVRSDNKNHTGKTL